MMKYNKLFAAAAMAAIGLGFVPQAGAEPAPGISGCDGATQAIRSVNAMGTPVLALFARHAYSSGANQGNKLMGPYTQVTQQERGVTMQQNDRDATTLCRWIADGGIVTPAHVLALK